MGNGINISVPAIVVKTKAYATLYYNSDFPNNKQMMRLVYRNNRSIALSGLVFHEPHIHPKLKSRSGGRLLLTPAKMGAPEIEVVLCGPVINVETGELFG